jgi:signal transduction histidine kinase
MTADIAHELRSPLTVINGYLEAMQDGSLEITQQRLSFIQNEVNQLNRLVDDLRTLALADAGELEINKEAISLQAMFTYLENAHILQANSKGIELLFEKEPSVEMIFADEGRIIQVLSNLITNAIRHTPEGGNVTIKGYQHNQDISIEVADTGEGISAQDLDLVFDRFYRGDTSRLSTSGESGLGLSIAKAIVEAHGGTIDVKSKVGEGTTFTVTLPHKPT